jgi:hypothetical protein
MILLHVVNFVHRISRAGAKGVATVGLPREKNYGHFSPSYVAATVRANKPNYSIRPKPMLGAEASEEWLGGCKAIETEHIR